MTNFLLQIRDKNKIRRRRKVILHYCQYIKINEGRVATNKRAMSIKSPEWEESNLTLWRSFDTSTVIQMSDWRRRKRILVDFSSWCLPRFGSTSHVDLYETEISADREKLRAATCSFQNIMPKCDVKTRYIPATFAWTLLIVATTLFFYYP